MDVAVTIVINNVVSYINGTLTPTVIQRIKEACSYSIQGAEFSAYGQIIYCPHCRKQTIEAKLEDLYSVGYPEQGTRGYRKCLTHGWVKPISLWDGRQYLFDGRNQGFPTGIITRVVDILKANGIEYTLQDARIAPITRELEWHGYKPRYYQLNAVRAVKKRSRGIIHACTGCGKTICIAWLIKETGVNTLILTYTKSVFNQVTKSISQSLKVPVGQIGDGSANIKNITVSMPQSLTESVWVPTRKLVKGVWKQTRKKVLQVKPKYKDFLANVEMFISDESHHISAATVQLIANACPNAYYRVGVTATPWRDDGEDVLIEAATGRIAYKYSATQAIEDGFLTRPNIHLVHFKQERQPVYTITYKQDKKTGNYGMVKEKVKYADVYDKVITNNERRNGLIARIAHKCYREGKSVLIIVKHIKHGENLYKMLQNLIVYYDPKKQCNVHTDLRWVNGMDDSELLQQTLDDLDTKKIRVCVATGIFSEGVDIRRLDCVINATAGDSSVNAMQVVGRALRKVIDPQTHQDLKPVVDIYDIYDTNIRWFSQHAANRQMIYSTEPGYNILEEDEVNY